MPFQIFNFAVKLSIQWVGTISGGTISVAVILCSAKMSMSPQGKWTVTIFVDNALVHEGNEGKF